jgi:hypothetical protein
MRARLVGPHARMSESTPVATARPGCDRRLLTETESVAPQWFDDIKARDE